MIGSKGTKLKELQERLNNGGGNCTRCGKRTDYLTIDHIAPLWFVDLLGLKRESHNHDWNFQALCRPCNVLKGQKLDFTDKRTIENMRRYLDIAEEYYSK